MDWLEVMSQKNQIQKVMQTNQYSERFGLVLSEEDANLLVQERSSSLRQEQRVEFGEGILPKLIFQFCDSTYLSQDNYVESIVRQQEIFYLYKNESLDDLSDDELLDYMKEKFDGVCQGDFEYLEGTVLEEFARNVRAESRTYMGSCREEEYIWSMN